MRQLIRYFFIGIVFPLLMQYVAYFQFTPNYTQDLFNKDKFEKFYGTKVYQSRVLGKHLQLWGYDQVSASQKIKNFSANEYNRRRLLHLDSQADVSFFLTYFFLACVFSVLTALTLLLLLDHRKIFGPHTAAKDVAVLFFSTLMAFTQFVVTPYDLPGYFFEALAILLFVHHLSSRRFFFFAALCGVIVVATLNRETSLLIISFMAAVYFSQAGLKKDWMVKMVVPALCFALPYLYLKLSNTAAPAITDESQLKANFTLTNPWALMGLLFAAFVFYFCLVTLKNTQPKMIRSFLFFSLPYLLIIPTVGMMVEYRLWMPVLEAVLVLALWREAESQQPIERS